MAAKIETSERQSAGATAGSGDKLDRQRRVSFNDLLRPSPQQKPGANFHEVLLGIGRHLNNETAALQTIYDRLQAIERETKRRGSRGFARYLLAICIGVAATLAWLSYGEGAKQILATWAPELGWSPDAKQMIANWVGQLGWTKPASGPENAAAQSSVSQTPQLSPVGQTAPAAVPPSAPIVPSIDPEQVHQIALDLATLRQTVEQIAAGQDQMGRVIQRLEGAVTEILVKTPDPLPPPLPTAAPARKPKVTALPFSRAPIVPPTSSAPLPLH